MRSIYLFLLYLCFHSVWYKIHVDYAFGYEYKWHWNIWVHKCLLGSEKYSVITTNVIHNPMRYRKKRSKHHQKDYHTLEYSQFSYLFDQLHQHFYINTQFWCESVRSNNNNFFFLIPFLSLPQISIRAYREMSSKHLWIRDALSVAHFQSESWFFCMNEIKFYFGIMKNVRI